MHKTSTEHSNHPVPADTLSVSPHAGTGGVDWAKVNAVAQQVLSSLAECVQDKWPVISSRGGSAPMRNYPLYSYWTFYHTQIPQLDPVVVAVYGKSSDNSTIMRGDICGEETGQIFYETAELHYLNDQQTLLMAAKELAESLKNQVAVVAGALAVHNDQG
jgi:hypothetical protein